MYGSDEYGSDEYGEYGSDEYGEYQGEYDYYNGTATNETEVSDMGRTHPGQDKMIKLIEEERDFESFDSKFGLTHMLPLISHRTSWNLNTELL